VAIWVSPGASRNQRNPNFNFKTADTVLPETKIPESRKEFSINLKKGQALFSS